MEKKQINGYTELQNHCERCRTRVVERNDNILVLANGELVEFNE